MRSRPPRPRVRCRRPSCGRPAVARRVAALAGLAACGADRVSRPEAVRRAQFVFVDQSPGFPLDDPDVTCDPDCDGELYLVDGNGRHLVRLTDNDADERDPAWSPDGRSIAFTSDRDGWQRVWAVGADGADPHPVPMPPAQEDLTLDEGPTWSPGGDSLAFDHFGTGAMRPW